jgi:hypothetical protein
MHLEGGEDAHCARPIARDEDGIQLGDVPEMLGCTTSQGSDAGGFQAQWPQLSKTCSETTGHSISESPIGSAALAARLPRSVGAAGRAADPRDVY